MNRQKIIIVVLALGLIGATAGLLTWLQGHQKLGQPGVKTSPLPDSKNLRVELPESVLDYASKFLPEQEVVIKTLPKDTSYGQRWYQQTDGFWIQMNAVLMGTDRTSIHQPQFCLEGAGWPIDYSRSSEKTIPISSPHPYNLPVMKLISTSQRELNGQKVTLSGLYVYWFVDERHLTAQHWQRMWWMAEDLLRTGTLDRWAYVSCFAVCMPGQEDATFDRMKKFIAAAVPQFQLTTGVPPAAATVAEARP
ncbi:MAG TPA: exosortase-associated EpsI family protein [Dongiaceae bacterium]|jgi:hypothetical protein|nr:exosortase-associated EpsI family protein [Dongiaceae bacterium]